jgi:putative ABC transport system substrate-binding protein
MTDPGDQAPLRGARSRLTRRAVLLLGGLTATAGIAWLAGCQTSAQPTPHTSARVDYLSPEANDAVETGQYLDAFRAAMEQYGWFEERNLIIDERFAAGQLDRLPGLAMDLIQQSSDVIVTFGTAAALAARDAVPSKPVVFLAVADPMGSGVVNNLARPGANVTGLSLFTVGLQSAKFLELLKSIVPGLTRVAVLHPAGGVGAANVIVPRIQEAANSLAVQLLLVEVASADDFAPAFASIRGWRAQALYVVSGVGTAINANYAAIAELALQGGLPSITSGAPYARAGGLMSFSANSSRQFGRAAYYVDRILRGANPGDLPVEQPTAFDVTFNSKTAQALGLTIPSDVAAQVTEWIQ